MTTHVLCALSITDPFLLTFCWQLISATDHRLRVLRSWKLMSSWRQHGHTWNFANGKTFRHQALMWDVVYDLSEEEREKGREVGWMASILVRLEARDWKLLYLPAYEINMILHSQASRFTPLQSFRAPGDWPNPSWAMCVTGVLWWRCFTMRNELSARIQGVMKTMVSASLAQRQSWHLLIFKGHPGHDLQDTFFSKHPRRADGYLFGWQPCTQTVDSAMSRMSRDAAIAWKH